MACFHLHDSDSGCGCSRHRRRPEYYGCCCRRVDGTDSGCVGSDSGWGCGCRHHCGWGCNSGCGSDSDCGCGSSSGCSCGSSSGCSCGSNNGCGSSNGCGCNSGCSCGCWNWGCGGWDWNGPGTARDVYYGYVLNTILSPGGEMTFAEGYVTPGSGITQNGSAITLPAGTYRISYSGNAQAVGATGGLVFSGAAVSLDGYVFPPSTDVVTHTYDTNASLARTFVVSVGAGTVLRVVNATQQANSTAYTNFNLVIERIALA